MQQKEGQREGHAQAVAELRLEALTLGVRFKPRRGRWWWTCGNTIYHASKDPWRHPEMVAHEIVHVYQQRRMWLPLWLLLYLLVPSFRWRMERDAFSEQMRWGLTVDRAVELIKAYHCVSEKEARRWFEEQT